MTSRDWTKIWHNTQVGVRLLEAHYVDHAFPRHSHDYYVVTVVRQGLQTFFHDGDKYFTPPGGVILINPDVVHTGEPADSNGYEMVCFYPTVAHMKAAVYELTGWHQALPFFKEVRVDDPWLVQNVLSLHNALTNAASPLESEARFTWTLAQLIRRYADVRFREQRLGRER
ncbi:MAG: AraC family ligand binding domain-containing protein, partial [Candidatus Promineifilaceae bacterium]